MKKIFTVLLTIGFVFSSVLISYCMQKNILVSGLDNYNILMEKNNFGTYNVINGWVRVEGFVSNDSYLYCANGEQNSYKPNNIMVKWGTNRYPLSEIMTFAESINFALKMQSQQSKTPPKQVTGGGSFTKNNIPLISFNIEFDDGTYQNQYYVVKDYGYVMISEMVNNPKNGNIADNVAKGILDSFRFN